ncbi:MAG: hypothetical protein Q9225_007208 [Loekoesia sp. 1 TL-2023]
MSEPRRSSRRLSARLGDKEDVPMVNGVAHTNEKSRSGQSSGSNAKQAKAGVNGATSSAAGTKAKRKLESDFGATDNEEDSDGFKYTRTRAKKAKAELTAQIPPIAEDKQEESPPKPVPVKRSRKRPSGSPNASAAENGEKPERRRRSARNSGDKDIVQEEPLVPPLEVKKKRKPKDEGLQEARKSKNQDRSTSTQPREKAAEEPPRTQPVDKPLDPIKVSLPFADTPIIRRNKEMRKGAENGSRRSSLGMRGRRASSLIDSGKSDALPHDEVDSSEFYKHIESSLTEPRRMKQLLTWCGTRALGEKPASSQQDFHARQAEGHHTTTSTSETKPQKRLKRKQDQGSRAATRQTPNRAPNLGNPPPPPIRIPLPITSQIQSQPPFHLPWYPRLPKPNLRPLNTPILHSSIFQLHKSE